MGKYDSLFDAPISPNTADIIAAKVASAGNRSERRRILKALNKTSTIAAYTQEKLGKEARKEVEERSNESFGYIMSMAGILLHDEYGWSDDDISDFFTGISNRLNGEWAEGKSAEDVAKELDEKTGIKLVVR